MVHFIDKQKKKTHKKPIHSHLLCYIIWFSTSMFATELFIWRDFDVVLHFGPNFHHLHNVSALNKKGD